MGSSAVTHPKKFKIDGMVFEIVTAGQLSDQQAAKIAMHFFRTHKFKKSDKGKLFQVITLFDSESANLLGE